jgi:hypothetical protein
VANSTFVFTPAAGCKALTDRGRVLPLFHYEALITPSASSKRRFNPERDVDAFLSALETIVLDRIKLPGFVLERCGPLNPAANCHGWVFARGQFGIHDRDVATILEEHRYERVSQPASGDLAIYRVDGVIVHSGIVHVSVPRREIVIRSKWGPFGVFFHQPGAHSGDCTFYRSSRLGNDLTILPAGR